MKATLKNIFNISLYDIYRNCKAGLKKKNASRLINSYLKNTELKKLHIGAGGLVLEGWLNVDLEPLDKRVPFMDAARRFPMQDNVFDYIFSEHLFEHLSLDQQLVMLKECYRVLKPSGKLRIATPNFDFIVNLKKHQSQLTDKYIAWSAEAFFSGKLEFLGEGVKDEVFVINNYFYSWGHQFIHNPYSIHLLLEKSAFKNIRQVKLYESESSDFRDMEKHGNHIPKEFNDIETMVFEAEK